MKLTQHEILISATTIISLMLFSSCNPAKFSSNYNLSSSTKSSNTNPEKEAVDVEKQLALFTQALEKLSRSSSFLKIQDAANSTWKYLGYRAKLSPIDGRSSYANVLSRTNSTLSFSELRQDQCPSGMMCIQVYRPYVETRLVTQCQNAIYTMSENLIVTASMAPTANYHWTVVSGHQTPACENEDEAFFTTLSKQIIQNDPLILVSDNFLFIQSSSITYMFSRY